MAEHLASIFGTEKDRVNCPFYFKIGACRHGDRCSRLHTKPSISPTLLLSNMYQRPDIVTPGVDAQGQPIDPRKIQTHFDDFYQDLFDELSKYGRLQTLNVCDNLADHMVGNVYAQFREEEHAAEALKNLTGRFYAGNPIIVDFSPVTDFREATCRQYEEDSCNRGGYCNFMHLKKISRELRRELFGMDNRGRHGRSRSPDRHRSNEDRSHRGHSRKYDERSHHHESRGRRRRSNSPGHRRGRSRSPRGSRERRPARDGSEERRARIEQWNREREEQKHESKVSTEENNDGNNGHAQDSNEQWNREREEHKHESKVSTEENNDGNNGHVQDGNEHHDYQQQQQQPLEGGYDY